VSKPYLNLILTESNKDESLNLLKSYIQNGWPPSKNKVCCSVKPYWNIQNEIHIMNNLLFKGNRLIIPKSLQKQILDKIHCGHLGINKTLNVARETVYWPNINVDIKNLIDQCLVCAKFKPNTTNEPLQCYEMSYLPWQQVGVDLLYFDGENFLVCMDYYSKYIELASLHKNYTVDNVVKHLKSFFARHGIPKSLVSDNGPPFNSCKFKSFLVDWDIEHITTSPYWSRSNGQAESAVKIVKNMLRKCKQDNSDIYLALLHYRSTAKGNFPSPAALLMSRNLRINLPMLDVKLKPEIVKFSTYERCHKQSRDRMSFYFDRKAKQTSYFFQPGDDIFFKRNPKSCWTPGIIKEKLKCGRSYYVVDLNGTVYRRNRGHIRPRKSDITNKNPSPSFSGSELSAGKNNSVVPLMDIVDPMSSANLGNGPVQNCVNDDNCVPMESPANNNYVTRSGRNIKRPKMYMHEKFD